MLIAAMECLNNSNIKPQKQIHVQQTNRNNLESISKYFIFT
ncbi:hypothetical protein LEP1GSC034_4650 [Leptospira interrogans str. 2003000735]|uniref:Uncharacterized protein n=1 Tax=Leptospira interrogans str. 2002000626 TaxID=996803 RepID=A0A829CZ09_LEPIR|nr:hypothetical protein LEP1GSC027_0394 [Leptospira interrogans str. 2002000624]EKO05916.1 hypothetical protein LEP1GSC077_0824 [Leptospira interrogans str. C10069]EKQ45459.1 hypothetical protein LEP1GSC026_2101 [Leptospira interrogans str. 2002000623]EMJ66857.1 hypothetical protein LEP1GSC034_4650 [Leptospira interrogans str. 2003000735]EMJ76815.1 hypothetical protein LEP1GSC032_0187 [Leptospira interrogans str. 2002000631]EMN54666.1 hypothetical protein LEP1GSC089_2163 [Leptospira interrogan